MTKETFSHFTHLEHMFNSYVLHIDPLHFRQKFDVFSWLEWIEGIYFSWIRLFDCCCFSNSINKQDNFHELFNLSSESWNIYSVFQIRLNKLRLDSLFSVVSTETVNINDIRVYNYNVNLFFLLQHITETSWFSVTTVRSVELLN